jgi:hypothetical protein
VSRKWFTRVGETQAAHDMVIAHHYSARWPSNVQLVVSHHEAGGLFGDAGPMIAACVFSFPAARWREEVWELARLVCRPDSQGHPLTSLISDACRVLKDRRAIDLVVSYADWQQGHHGGIYQAASWRFHGQRKRARDGVVVNGQFLPARTANHCWGTNYPDQLRDMGIDAEPHYDEGKFLYWRALTRRGRAKAARLGLQDEPYPKPGTP